MNASAVRRLALVAAIATATYTLGSIVPSLSILVQFLGTSARFPVPAVVSIAVSVLLGIVLGAASPVFFGVVYREGGLSAAPRALKHWSLAAAATSALFAVALFGVQFWVFLSLRQTPQSVLVPALSRVTLYWNLLGLPVLGLLSGVAVVLVLAAIFRLPENDGPLPVSLHGVAGYAACCKVIEALLDLVGIIFHQLTAYRGGADLYREQHPLAWLWSALLHPLVALLAAAGLAAVFTVAWKRSVASAPVTEPNTETPGT